MLRSLRKSSPSIETWYRGVGSNKQAIDLNFVHIGSCLRNEHTEVCVGDARSGSSEDAVRLKVPMTFLPKLAQGTFELGEGDEPSNSYSFGQKAEFFQQTFSGKCLCQSGYVGIRLARSSRDVLQKDWTELREKIDKEVVSFPDAESGLLFAGPVVHADSVSVYKVTESGDITGITLTADAEELD